MKNPYMAKAEIVIDAPVSKVWEALVTPEMIKQYLFGTDVESNWQVGAPIVYRGEWQGKAYEDKGTILKFEPGKVFSSTYWSSMSGIPDEEENYQVVTYALEPVGGGTHLVLTQENVESEESAKHSEQNWNMVLGKLKELVER